MPTPPALMLIVATNALRHAMRLRHDIFFAIFLRLRMPRYVISRRLISPFTHYAFFFSRYYASLTRYASLPMIIARPLLRHTPYFIYHTMLP